MLVIDPTDRHQRVFAAVVRALDWLARFRIAEGPPGPRRSVEDRDGAVLTGRHAVCLAVSRLPVTAWFALPALLLPGVRRARRSNAAVAGAGTPTDGSW